MPTTEERKVAVPKYFMKSPEKPNGTKQFLMIGLGVLMLIGGVASLASDSSGCGGALILGGLLVGAVGALGLTGLQSKYRTELAKTEPKPSDAQMDAWLAEDTARFKADALQKLDIVREQIVGDPDKPITVIGPRAGAMAQVGQDGIIRFSAYDFLVVHLTSYHLAAYQCEYNFVDGLPYSESTKEYHYSDVVSVSTQTDASGLFAVLINGQQKSISRMQKFALSVASGEKIEVAIAFPQAEDILKTGRLAPTGVENAISMIRAMLREKKGGTV
jgi:phage terminase large subunit-like protein